MISIFILGLSYPDGKNSITTINDQTTVAFKWLRTEGNRIVDEDGKRVLLHGLNRSGMEYDRHGNNMSESEYKYIYDEWQVKVIRLPFNQEWVLTNEDYKAQLDTVVNWIKKNGAYIILDLQWQNTTVKIPSIPDTNAVDMWKILATRYKDDPAILYDIHNEAHDISFAEWQNRAIEIIEGIRSVHPRSLILVSGLDWASDLSAWADNPLHYDNVVYSVHVYPWMGGINSWVLHLARFVGMHQYVYSWLGGSDSWDQHFGNYTEQIPIFVGEFGGGSGDLKWGRELIAYLNQKQLGWTAWSWVDKPYLTQSDHRTPTEFGSLVQESLIRLSSVEDYGVTGNDPDSTFSITSE